MFLKKNIFLLFALTLCKIASAQIFESSLYAKAGAKIEITEYDKAGAKKSTTVNTVKDVQTSSGMNASVRSVKTEANGTVSEDKTIHYNCDQQGVLIGMGADDIDTKKEAVLDYPSNMTAGMMLKNNVAFEFRKEEDGKTIKVSVKIYDRKVVGKERISVKAGSWDCTKITYKFRFALKMGMLNLPINADCTEWFNPEVGTVRNETWVKGAKEGYSEITALSR